MIILKDENVFGVIVNSELNKDGKLETSVGVGMDGNVVEYMEEKDIDRLKEIADEVAHMLEKPIKEFVKDQAKKKALTDTINKIIPPSIKELLDELEETLNNEQDEILEKIEKMLKDIK